MMDEVFEMADVVCVAETDAAICVTGGDFDGKKWIPKGQLHDDSEVYKTGTNGTLIVSFWFARKKRWT